MQFAWRCYVAFAMSSCLGESAGLADGYAGRVPSVWCLESMKPSANASVLQRVQGTEREKLNIKGLSVATDIAEGIVAIDSSSFLNTWIFLTLSPFRAKPFLFQSKKKKSCCRLQTFDGF